MFEYICGVLEEIRGDNIVLAVGGVGYDIVAPLSTIEALPSPGETVKLYTHFHVREDTQRLFGFLTKAERNVFRRLITISMIGPKVAINVLSGMSVQDVVYSVQAQDSSRFKAISGVGPKTAQRVVLELKGKLDVGDIATPAGARTPQPKTDPRLTIRNDAYAALLSLGYNESQVMHSLSRVEQAIEKDAPVEAWIRKALQVI